MSRANVRSPQSRSATSNRMRAMCWQFVHETLRPSVVVPPNRTPRSRSFHQTMRGGVFVLFLYLQATRGFGTKRSEALVRPASREVTGSRLAGIGTCSGLTLTPFVFERSRRHAFSNSHHERRCHGGRAMKCARWPTRKERDRMRDEISAAGGVSAWIRAGKTDPIEERTRKARMNALAIKCGMSRPYPEIESDEEDGP